MDSFQFRNKKILFISVQFFNYEKLLAEKIKSLGGTVIYFDERPSNSIFAKGIIRLKRSFYQKMIDQYYREILEKIKDVALDYFFLIKGEVVPNFFIEALKEKNPNAILVYYTFDSFKNNPHSVEILKYFDRKFTFDSQDAKEYQLNFRPLFFSNEYSEVYELKKENYKNDIMFVGTAHSDRYLISEKVANWCSENNLKSYSFYYSPSKLVFLFKKYFDSSFEKFDYKKMTFKSIAHQDIIELYKNSKVVLDINHPGQKGLTMRTFESLGAGRKLITTNEQIVNYPFYDADNIYVIDRKNIQLDKEFFKKEFNPIAESLYQEMSIDGFLKALFFNSESNHWDKVLNKI